MHIAKIIVLTNILLICGCAEKGIVATIFLKETNRKFYNLNGDACLLSGYEIIKEEDGKHYDLVTYYSNCLVHEEHQLEEYEIPQWKPKMEINQ